ncbi:hypothetical protein [Sphingobacterium hungaricum]|nr:hypothetical protein [Sphingobacterium hungaricum]
MRTEKKLKYTALLFELQVIYLEQGIATTSQANVIPGSNSNASSPEVEDWQTNTTSTNKVYLY